MLPPGTSTTIDVKPTTDATYKTTVEFNGLVVQEREKGYISPGPPGDKTCIAVSRTSIAVGTCKAR